MALRSHVALLVALGLLSGCSAAQLAYNRLDLLAGWQVSRHVDLKPAQEAVFEREFERAWHQHRREELPRYAAVLRRLAEPRATPDLAALEAASREYNAAWTRILDAATPIGCALGPGLDDTQVTSLLAAIDEDLADYRAEQVEPAQADLRRERERELQNGLRRWLGEITPAQRSLLQRWNAERVWIASAWLDYRRSWRTAFADLLARRHETDFCPRLGTLLEDGDSLWTDGQRRLFEANRQAWLDLFLALGPTLTEAQRRHWRARAADLATDLESLVADGPPEPGQAAGN